MKVKIALSIAAIIFGLISGKSALVAAQSASPPIDLETVQFAFMGCPVAIVLFIGIQIIRKNPKYGDFTITGMLTVSLFFVSSGVRAFMISDVVSPSSIIILVIGIGALIGVAFSSFFHKLRHAPTS